NGLGALESNTTGSNNTATELAEALGCTITDTGFKGDGHETFLAVHPNPNDLNPRNNAFYMSPMRPEQQALEAPRANLSSDRLTKEIWLSSSSRPSASS